MELLLRLSSPKFSLLEIHMCLYGRSLSHHEAEIMPFCGSQALHKSCKEEKKALINNGFTVVFNSKDRGPPPPRAPQETQVNFCS